MSTFHEEALAALTPTPELIQAKEREIIEAKKEDLSRRRQSLSDRRKALDDEEAGFAAEEEVLTQASNELTVEPEVIQAEG